MSPHVAPRASSATQVVTGTCSPAPRAASIARFASAFFAARSCLSSNRPRGRRHQQRYKRNGFLDASFSIRRMSQTADAD